MEPLRFEITKSAPQLTYPLRYFHTVAYSPIKRGYQEVWDITQEMGFNVLARALLVSGKLTKKEYDDLQRFNSLRNRVVHKFFLEPYEKDYKGVPKKEYDLVFQAGMRLVDQIDYKAGISLVPKTTANLSFQSTQ